MFWYAFRIPNSNFRGIFLGDLISHAGKVAARLNISGRAGMALESRQIAKPIDMDSVVFLMLCRILKAGQVGVSAHTVAIDPKLVLYILVAISTVNPQTLSSLGRNGESNRRT